jgi:hypothetical protein
VEKERVKSAAFGVVVDSGRRLLIAVREVRCEENGRETRTAGAVAD